MTRAPRDYRAEELRRNEIAVELGYSSRAAVRTARKRGTTLTAKQSRERTKAIERGEVTEVNRWIGRVATPADLAFMRRRSRDWSRFHSRNARSKFNSRWGDEQMTMYYQTFVNQKVIEDEQRFPLVGFASDPSDRDNELIEGYFRSIGVTVAAIEKFNYLSVGT